jgi:hypothetical protein
VSGSRVDACGGRLARILVRNLVEDFCAEKVPHL